jgi:hypothetical protein
MADDASATSSAIPSDLKNPLDAASSERATVIAILAMLFYQGFAVSIVGIASPWIGKSLHLDGAGIARLFASWRWMLVIAVAGIAMLPDNAEAPRKRPIAKIALLSGGDSGASMDH